MSIFDEKQIDLTICDIYDIDWALPIAYKSSCKNLSGNTKVFNLCQITNYEYTFYKNTSANLNVKEFTDYCINILRSCPVGKLENVSKYIQEHCSVISDMHIDIIFDIREACDHDYTISNTCGYYKIILNFPSPYPYNRQPDNFIDCSWVVMYKCDKDLDNIYLVALPLIPREEYIDIFKPA